MTTWIKSSFSFSNGNCVECAFRKSSRSVLNGACTEVAQCPDGVAVRDSKLGDASPVLFFGAKEWEAFTRRVKAGVL